VATIAVAIVFAVILLSFPAHIWNAWREYKALKTVHGRPLLSAREYVGTLPPSSAVCKRLETFLMHGETNVEMLRERLIAQSTADIAAIESRFRFTHALIWVLPVMGFMGTAFALTQSIGGFGETLKLSAEVSIIAERLSQTVIPGLSQAFMVTVLALLSAVVAYIDTITVQGWQNDIASELDATTSIWFGEVAGATQNGSPEISQIINMAHQIVQQLAVLTATHAEMATAARDLQSAANELQGAALAIEKSWRAPFKITVDRG
jgi:hypothetical protein